MSIEKDTELSQWGDDELSAPNFPIFKLIEHMDWTNIFGLLGYKDPFPQVLYTTESAQPLLNTIMHQMADLTKQDDTQLAINLTFDDAKIDGDKLLLGDMQIEYPTLENHQPMSVVGSLDIDLSIGQGGQTFLEQGPLEASAQRAHIVKGALRWIQDILSKGGYKVWVTLSSFTNNFDKTRLKAFIGTYIIT